MVTKCVPWSVSISLVAAIAVERRALRPTRFKQTLLSERFHLRKHCRAVQHGTERRSRLLLLGPCGKTTPTIRNYSYCIMLTASSDQSASLEGILEQDVCPACSSFLIFGTVTCVQRSFGLQTNYLSQVRHKLL